MAQGVNFSATQLGELRKKMNQMFNLAELQMLSFDLGVDFEELAGEIKSSKVQALIVHLQQRRQLPQLIETLSELRPQGNWETVTQMEEARTMPPFKGMAFFHEEDSHLFFGRDSLIADVVARLHSDQFVAVIGASGSGKSSLIRAGVLPALRWRDVPVAEPQPPEARWLWPIHVITPGSRPLEALAISLTRDVESVTAVTTLMDDLRQDERSLHLFVSRLLDKVGKVEHLLLVVDQFEEIFTLCKDKAEQKAFVNNLMTAVSDEQSGPTRLIITLRADFYSHCSQFIQLRRALSERQLYIGPMNYAELRQAIEQPALAYNLIFEPGLVDRFLQDVGADASEEAEPGALPLLSHALLETWQRREGNLLTHAGYEDAGGVKGAIAHTAETIYESFSATEQELTRALFLRLTELGEGTQDTRRKVSLDELNATPEVDDDQTEVILRALIAARLVTVDRLEQSGKEFAEVTHEALIREWPLLREWINENRDALRTHRKLTEAAQNWIALEKDEGALYRGIQLAQAQAWCQRNRSRLNQTEQAFLAASETAVALRAELKQKQERRIRQALVISIALFVVALLAFGMAIVSNGRTKAALAATELEAKARTAAERVAVSRQVATTARLKLDEDEDELGLLLALSAYQITDTAEAQTMVYQALHEWRGQGVMAGHAGAVNGGGYSGDGRTFVTTAWDTIRVWQMVGEPRTFVVGKHDDGITSAALNYDGTRLVTTGLDQRARIWDVEKGGVLWEMDFGVKVTASHYSSDGRYVAIGSENKDIILLEQTTPLRFTQIATLSDSSSWGFPTDIMFSPDSSYLVATYHDGVTRLWDLQNFNTFTSFGAMGKPMRSVDFSPDGQLFATAGDDQHIRLWHTHNEEAVAEPIVVIDIMNDLLGEVQFSPDGRYLAIGSSAGIAYLWHIPSESLFPLVGHTQRVPNVQFTPDGQYLVTASWDGTARVWNIASKKTDLILNGHGGARVNNLMPSPDSQHLVTMGDDATARLWRIGVGSEVWRRRYPSGIRFMTYTKDAQRIVAVDGYAMHLWQPEQATVQTIFLSDMGIQEAALNTNHNRLAAISGGQLQLWGVTEAYDVVSMASVSQTLTMHDLAFSPTDDVLATGSQQGVVQIWDAKDGDLIKELRTSIDDVYAVAFMPNGKSIIMAGSDGLVQVWDWQAGVMVEALRVGQVPIRVLAVAPSGGQLAVIDEGREIYVWTAAENGRFAAQNPVSMTHPSPARSLAFRWDGQRLVVGGEDGSVIQWDWQRGEAVQLSEQGVREANQWITAVVFHPQGKPLLTTAGYDGMVRVWPATIEAAIDLACSRLSRPLTEVEAAQYLQENGTGSFICPTIVAPMWTLSAQLALPETHSLVASAPFNEAQLPTFSYFEATPKSSLMLGESAFLRWEVVDEVRLFLLYDGQKEGVTSPWQRRITPSKTTTYRLVAENEMGNKIAREITIFVNEE